MSIPTLTTDLNAHQNLADQPTLTASQLKQAWDKPANDIKDYINNTLIPAIESISSSIDTAIATKLQARYHVGSIIVSSVATNPATYLGFGTWELTGKGRVEIGVDPEVTAFNEGGKTGGSNTITLQANQIPTLTSDGTAVTGLTKSTNNKADLTYQAGGTVVTDVTTTTGSIAITNNSQQAVSILPQYETVYRYKRVS